MRLSSFKINLEVLNHIQRRLKALCTIREKADWSLTPKVSVKKKTSADEGNPCFPCQVINFGYRSRTNSSRSCRCLWLWESQPTLCFTINVFYLFWSNAHLAPPPPRPLWDISETQRGHTQWWQQEHCQAAAFPSSRRRRNRFVFKHAVAAELRVEAGGLSSRLLQVQSLQNQ